MCVRVLEFLQPQTLFDAKSAGYAAVKRKEVLIHAMVWMKPENIMLCERQTQKDLCCMVPCM